MAHYIMQHFKYDHLPNEELKEVGRNYFNAARYLDDLLDSSTEKEFALRRLLESRDCAIRARNMDLIDREQDQHLEELTKHLYPKGTSHVSEPSTHI